jgi:hypothetical protein
MNAETVFNVAIHLSDHELQRLNNLITAKLKHRTKSVLKKTLITNEEAITYVIKHCFSKIKIIRP